MFTCGKLIETFCILPSININWMRIIGKNFKYTNRYDIQLSWLYWYVSTKNVRNYLDGKL